MKYISIEEFYAHINIQALAALTDSRNGDPDTVVLEYVNEEAAADIDGYLRGMYALPLPEPTPLVIRSIAADIMKYRLYQRRDAKNLPEEIFKMYKLAVDKLKDIKARKLVLDAPGVGAASESVLNGGVQSWTPTQKFGNNFTKLFD